MIYGIFHKGSGLGNQLHRFVGTKIIAIKKGEKHSMIAPELFKGKDFIKLDFEPNDIKYTIEEPSGKVVTDVETIDGEFQGEEDFIDYIDDIRKWLKVEPLDIDNNVCVINFRGGEYVGVPDLFLPQEYWDRAIKEMIENNPEIRFEVHTDDPVTASKFFPYFDIYSDIGLNWRSIRYAKYLILSNSSFAILPAHLNEDTTIIAPKYWAGYNKGYWQLEENNYGKFNYI